MVNPWLRLIWQDFSLVFFGSFLTCSLSHTHTHCIVLLLCLHTPRKTQPDVCPSSRQQFAQQNADWLCMMCYLALVSIHFYFITYRASNPLHMMKPSSIAGFCFRILSSSCVENCRAPSSRWSLAWCTRDQEDTDNHTICVRNKPRCGMLRWSLLDQARFAWFRWKHKECRNAGRQQHR